MPFYEKRPWGRMWKFIHTKKFWLKFLWVTGRTSYQAHKDRSEWHLGLYKVNPMEKHRLHRGAYVEVAMGEPKEDDVIRYEDDYDRAEETIVMVSGGFDPVHIGHVRMFQEAKKLGTKLVVVLNSDAWLVSKKGKVFMKQDERAELVQGFEWIDETYILEGNRIDIIEAIEKIRPHIFANGGDRRDENDIPEAEICKKLGIKMVFNVGGDKVRSSSDLLRTYHTNLA